MRSTLSMEGVLQLDSWDAEEVRRINHSGVDLVLIERSDFPAPTEQDLASARVDSARSVVDQHNAQAQIEDALSGLGLSGCAGLAEDMHEVTARFLKQFEVKRANLRIDLVDRQSCPKFHCDARQIRLITTYVGATTEYRHAWDSEEAHAAPLGAIALLKGTTHPTHVGEQVLHRSPAMIESQRRLCLVLDY